MQRRELIKAIVPLAFVKMPFKGKEVDAVEVEKSKFVVFADPQCIDFDALFSGEGIEGDPLAGSVWYPVRLRNGDTIEDVIKIYKIQE